MHRYERVLKRLLARELSAIGERRPLALVPVPVPAGGRRRRDIRVRHFPAGGNRGRATRGAEPIASWSGPPGHSA